MIAIKSKAKGNTIGLYLGKQARTWSFLASLLLSTSSLAAQGINLQMRKARLSEVFAAIEKQSDYTFFYNDQLLEPTRMIDLNVSNGSVDEALRAALSTYALTYEIKGKTIFISEKRIASAIKPEKQMTLHGKVLDEAGQPLAGASVRVKGSKTGALTDSNGAFSIQAPKGALLVISYVGYSEKEMPVTDAENLTITLTTASNSLEQIVVVGYGTSRKGNLSTAVGSVKGEELLERPSAQNLLQGMAGKIAGVNINLNSGKPGGNPAIKIRGTGSINGSNTPLYVIDGMVGADPTTIDPNIIQSVDVLKDASSAAIYGSRGANGVVVITTKNGDLNSSQIAFDNTLSFASLARELDLLDANESLEMFKRQYEYVPGRIAPHLDPNNFFLHKDDLFNSDGTPKYNINWQREATRLAVSHQHALTFSGGKDNIKVLANVSYRNNDGIMLNSYYKQLNGFLNLDWEVKPWLNIKANLNAGGYQSNNIDNNTLGLNALRQSLEYLPFLPVTYPDGTYSRKGDYPGAENSENPVKLLNEVKNVTGRTQSLGNLMATFRLSDKLDFNASVSGQLSSSYNLYYGGRTVFDVAENQQGIAERGHTDFGSWTTEHYFSYTNSWAKHHLNAVAGASWYYYVTSTDRAGAEGFFDDFFQYNNLGTGTTPRIPSSGKTENQLNSYFARANYNFDDRYLFGASFRIDGSSRFGSNNKYGYFPSFSAAWRISRESFFKNMDSRIDDLKLRISYGIVGNAEIGDYVTLNRYNNGQAVFNNAYQSAVTLAGLGNPDLRWEKAKQLDIGFDMSLFNGKVLLTADVYDKRNDDLLYLRKLPVTTGYTNVFDNIGSIQNRGVELGLNTVNIRKADFSWTTGYNFSINRSKVIDINNDVIYPWFGRIIAGGPLNEFYGYERLGVWGTSEAEQAAQYGKKPGDIKYRDTNGNGAKDADDRVNLGNAMPKWEMNMTNTISYKGFSLFIDLQGVYGNHVVSLAKALMVNPGPNVNSFKSILNAWTPENQNTMLGQLRVNSDGFDNEAGDSFNVEDASFLRVRNVGLSYRFDKNWLQKIKLNTLVLGVNVENALLFTGYTGYDPEVTSFDAALNQGVDVYQYPKPRTISFSLKTSF
ncbi:MULTISPECIES: TonB-dependent receptor [Olivibacter]|jgi:TonB-linked SusC/RagA family outer membrane protein|uniref:TonB-dependent receptor n=1 Tax=Olivibacter oleidegradans TaxID=760123 RepID=A0ABV6HMH7_9SPHI|nr:MULTISPECIES: TonB-dependent receptor [Olivibacter]QEL02818.1 TonB-dependent receptor [Olivibacter sp. LS-1]